MRQPGESEEGKGTLTFAQIKEMAAEVRFPLSGEVESCRPWEAEEPAGLAC